MKSTLAHVTVVLQHINKHLLEAGSAAGTGAPVRNPTLLKHIQKTASDKEEETRRDNGREGTE